MSEKQDPNVTRHSLKTRIAGIRSRVRRGHLITAGVILVVLIAGGVAWAIVGGGPAGTQPTGSPAGAQPGENQPAGKRVEAAPVPTWTPPSRGKHANSAQPAGLPTDLSAKRNGDTVTLQWKDNSTNENGFTVFVSQGRNSFQVVVPAGTTQYQFKAASQDTRTCFSVAPFTWTNPVVARPTKGGWKCTGRDND